MRAIKNVVCYILSKHLLSIKFSEKLSMHIRISKICIQKSDVNNFTSDHFYDLFLFNLTSSFNVFLYSMLNVMPSIHKAMLK